MARSRSHSLQMSLSYTSQHTFLASTGVNIESVFNCLYNATSARVSPGCRGGMGLLLSLYHCST